ncbi:MAG TPA: ribose ABC transporter permease [Anaerolineae bacterium]|nr:ribose ABC transporter permease [Anaerolineae bacterium]HIP71720.1 ribose ABC transporter permease [Anaerolineae bacterium]
MSQLTISQKSTLRQYLQRYGLILSFLLLCLVLTLLSDRFLTASNLTNVLRQSTINGIIAVGMTFVILTAGIDLSVGSILALSSVITAGMLVADVNVPLAVTLGLGIGAAMGLMNGVIITRFKVPPFVTTLGMMTIARGLALTYTEGRPITGLPDSFRVIGTGSIGPIPIPIIIAAATFVIGYIILTRTTLGQYIYAIGNNPVAARYAGIKVHLNTTFVYMLSGLLSALAGLILIARLNSAQPTAGLGFEFDAIAAVVVGGTSFAGGQGSLGGTLIGVLIIAVLDNGLNLLNVSAFYQPVVSGIVIAVALLLHRAIR